MNKSLRSKSILRQTEAIILQTRDHGESDRVVTFYTKAGGKLVGIAKGARRSKKRFVHSFELCSLVDLTYKTRNSLIWIDSCKLETAHCELRSDLEKWGYAVFLLEIVREMIAEKDPDEEVFLLLKEALGRLAGERDPLNLVLLFMVRFMANAGYLSSLDRCRVCDCPVTEKKRWYWDLQQGTLLCTGHSPTGKSFSVDVGTLKLVHKLRSLPLPKIWRLRFLQGTKTALFRFLVQWICSETGKDLKSLKLLEQIAAV